MSQNNETERIIKSVKDELLKKTYIIKEYLDDDSNMATINIIDKKIKYCHGKWRIVNK